MDRLFGQRRPEDGAVAVEFALILPILILLVLGIVEFGFAFNNQVTLTHAAREGVRTAALATGDPAQVTRAAAVGAGMDPNDINVDVQPPDPYCDGAPSGTNAEVTATYNYSLFVLGFLLPDDITLSGEAVMRCGG